jgi:hypothetical protein
MNCILKGINKVVVGKHLKHYFVFFADDQSFSLSCRCGGKYTISKDEAEDVNLIACDTCSLVIELLHCC